MTNNDIISAKAAFQGLSQNIIDYAFTNRGLIGTDTYDVSFLKQIELVAADLYVELLSFPDFQEGSLAITYPRGELRNLAIQIYEKYNDLKSLDLGFEGGIQNVELW